MKSESPHSGTTADRGRRWEAREIASPGDGATYSRFVRIMKFALPLIAFALLAVMIAWPGIISQDESFTITFSSASRVDDDLRMVSPRFTGSDERGRPYFITADTAIQHVEDRNRVTLDRIQADMTLLNDAWVILTAPTGELRTDTKRLQLSGPIDLFSDRGYEFHAREALIDFTAGRIVSDEPVDGQGPFGLLAANAMEVTDGGERVMFSQGVRVTLMPEQGRTGS